MNNKIDTFIFDLDGVLVDACDWHYDALNYALQKNNFSSISIEEHNNLYNGLPTKTKLKMIGLSENEIEAVSIDKQNITLDIIKEKCLRDKGKISFLNYLKEKNIKVGCVTNSIKKTTMAMLCNSGIIDFIDEIITNEDVRIPKPNPEGYIKMLNSLKSSPETTIIVEDSQKGIEAAVKTKCFLWIVKNATMVNKENLSLYLSINNLEIRDG
jgi:beta-phosphoglucomutase